MNILILNWRDIKNPKSGGAEIVTMEHAKAWVRLGHSVDWFTSKFVHAKDEEIIHKVRIIRKGNSITTFFFAVFFYLARKNFYDIVIDEFHGLPYFTPLYVKKPIVAFIHEVAREIWDLMYPFPINVLGKIFESISLSFYHSIPFWTDAKSTINSLEEEGIKRTQCIAIPCPINAKSLKKIPKKEVCPTFIFVSRLVQMKGIEDVIKAFYVIGKSQTDAQLLIVGRGERKYTQKLKNIVKELGITKKVKFLGFVEESKKIILMRKSHILLHASVKEGWGLVILEAASQGTPSVVYNVDGLRDVVLNGKTGVVVKENTPEMIADSSLRLLRDSKRYKKYQERAIKWADSFSWEKATLESTHLLEQVRKNKTQV